MHPAPTRSRPVSKGQLAALCLATVAAGAVAAIGMLASFHTVSSRMQASFHGWAWTVPVTLDLAIASFSILELALLRMALPHMLARLGVYAATAATVYLNIRSVGEPSGRAQLIAHAAMPAVWALYIELLRGAAATLTRREHQVAEHPVLALLLAPRPVITAWRRDILDHTTGPRPRPPKMSTTRGHFPHPVRTRPDIYPWPPSSRTSSIAADDSSDAEAPPAAETAPTRIGKGRGRSSRHAVLDLAGRDPELTSAQIADQLDLSPRTVRRHLGAR